MAATQIGAIQTSTPTEEDANANMEPEKGNQAGKRGPASPTKDAVEASHVTKKFASNAKAPDANAGAGPNKSKNGIYTVVATVDSGSLRPIRPNGKEKPWKLLRVRLGL